MFGGKLIKLEKMRDIGNSSCNWGIYINERKCERMAKWNSNVINVNLVINWR